MTSPVLYAVHDAVATITLNRPQVLNALDDALMQALAQSIQEASAPSVKAVLITGAGRAFSSGADLSTIQTREATQAPVPIHLGQALIERYNPIILGIRQLRKPVISAVNGAAAGAGMSIALAADIVLASESATFLQAFAKLGLVPDAGSTFFLPRLIGEANARAMMLMAAPVKADQALRMGLVWQVYPEAQLMPAAQTLAATMARQATHGLALIKDALDATWQHDLPQQLTLEASLQTQAGQTRDFFEGVRAFIEKRPAQFKGE